MKFLSLIFSLIVSFSASSQEFQTQQGIQTFHLDKESETLSVFDRNHQVGLYNAKTGELLRLIKMAKTGNSPSGVFSPDGKLIATTTTQQGSSYIWISDVLTGSILKEIYVSGRMAVEAKFLSSEIIALAGTDQGHNKPFKISLVRWRDLNVIGTLNWEGFSDNNYLVEFDTSPDQKYVTAVDYNNVKRLIWEAKSGKIVAEIPAPEFASRSSNIVFLGDKVVISFSQSMGGFCQEVYSIYDLESKSLVKEFAHSGNKCLGNFVISPDNKRLATYEAGGSNIFEFDIDKGQLINQVTRYRWNQKIFLTYTKNQDLLAIYGDTGSVVKTFINSDAPNHF